MTNKESNLSFNVNSAYDKCRSVAALHFTVQPMWWQRASDCPKNEAHMIFSFFLLAPLVFTGTFACRKRDTILDLNLKHSNRKNVNFQETQFWKAAYKLFASAWKDGNDENCHLSPERLINQSKSYWFFLMYWSAQFRSSGSTLSLVFVFQNQPNKSPEFSCYLI